MINKQAQAVDLQKAFNGSKIDIPYITETKEFLRSHEDLSYAIPAFVGGNSAIIIMRFKTKKSSDLMTLINPTYLSVSGLILSEETQYGVEGVYLVARHPKIEVMYVKTPEGVALKQTLLGKSALMLQQAYEALQGIRIDDFGLRIDNNEDYQRGSEEEKTAIGVAYLNSLKEVLSEIEKDPEVQKYEKAVDFTSERIAVGVEADKLIEEARERESKDVNSKNGDEGITEAS